MSILLQTYLKLFIIVVRLSTIQPHQWSVNDHQNSKMAQSLFVFYHQSMPYLNLSIYVGSSPSYKHPSFMFSVHIFSLYPARAAKTMNYINW